MNWQETLTQLEAGTVRAANQDEQGNWHANIEVKEAILSAFKAGENIAFEGIYKGFVDKHNLPAREFTADDKVRLVPGGSSVRRGAHVAAGVIIMPPAYINVGAFVDTGTMVDSHALIGSCAQIGKNVHLSGGVGIGGVLEPLQAGPTIIEDNCFIGARSEVVEGVVVEEGSVISMGVYIGQSTKIFNRMTGEITYGRIPAGSVVVSGNLPSKDGSHSLYCAVIIKHVDERTRSKTSLNDLLRD